MVKNQVSTSGLDQTIVVTESDFETTSERSPLLGPVSIKILNATNNSKPFFFFFWLKHVYSKNTRRYLMQ